MQLNCKVIKKVANPPFLHQPHFQGFSPFLAKFLVLPQVTHFLEGPAPPFNKGGGVPTMSVNNLFLPNSGTLDQDENLDNIDDENTKTIKKRMLASKK